MGSLGRLTGRLVAILTIGAIAVGASVPAADAGRWQLDPQFGSHGTARLSKRDVWSLLAPGAQRSVFVGGTRVCPPEDELESCPERPLVIVRVSAHGGLVAGFGLRGTVTLPITEAQMFASKSGRLLIAGKNRLGHLALTRLNATGRLDPSFGHDGSVQHSLRGRELKAVGVESDGDILVVSQEIVHSASGGAITFLRLLPSGALDRTFGDDGYLTPTGAAMTVAPTGSVRDVAFAPNGSILLLVEDLEAGAGSNVEQGLASLEEFSAIGAPVPGFGIEGRHLLAPGPLEPSISGGFQLFPLADGGAEVTFGGDEEVAAPKSEFGHEFRSYLDLFRVSANGEPDLGFGRSGASLGLVPFEKSVLERDGDTLLVGAGGDQLVVGGLFSGGASDSSLGGDSGQPIAPGLGDGLTVGVPPLLAGSNMSLLVDESVIVRLRD